MTDLSEILAGTNDLLRGETEPMARYLASGGAVTPQVRAALVRHLRNPQKPGKRRWSQERREHQIAWLFYILHDLGKLHRAQAIREIIRMEPNLTPATIENYLRNSANKSAR